MMAFPYLSAAVDYAGATHSGAPKRRTTVPFAGTSVLVDRHPEFSSPPVVQTFVEMELHWELVRELDHSLRNPLDELDRFPGSPVRARQRDRARTRRNKRKG